MGRNNAVDAPFFARLPAVMYVFIHSRRQPSKNTRLNRILSPHLGWLPLLCFGVFGIRLMLRFLLGCQWSCTPLYTLAASQKKEKNTRLNPHSFAPFGLFAVAGFWDFRDTVDAPFFVWLPAVMYVFVHSRRQPKRKKYSAESAFFAPFGLVAVAGFWGFRDTVDAPFFCSAASGHVRLCTLSPPAKKRKKYSAESAFFRPIWAGCRCWVLGLLLFCRVFRLFVFGYFCFAVFVFFSSSYS